MSLDRRWLTTEPIKKKPTWKTPTKPTLVPFEPPEPLPVRAPQQPLIPLQQSVGTGQAKPEKKYGYVGFPLPPEHAAYIQALAKQIDPADLAGDGVEAEPHVTALYGLHDGVSGQHVQQTLQETVPPKIKLGALSSFPPGKGSDKEVLKIDVDSPDLHRIHRSLRGLPHTLTFPDYKPHVTVAYVKPGTAKKYVGTHPGDGMQIPLRDADHSTADKVKTLIRLGNQVGKGQGESEYGPFDPVGYEPDQSILDREAQAKLATQTPPEQTLDPTGTGPQPGDFPTAPQGEPIHYPAAQPPESPNTPLGDTPGTQGAVQPDNRGWPGQVADAAQGVSQGLDRAIRGVPQAVDAGLKAANESPIFPSNWGLLQAGGPLAQGASNLIGREDEQRREQRQAEIETSAADQGYYSSIDPRFQREQPDLAAESGRLQTEQAKSIGMQFMPTAGLPNLAEHANPAIRAVQKMLTETEAHPPSKSPVEDFRRMIVQHFTDQGVHLAKAQEMAQQALDSGDLPENLRPADLMRLKADPAAEQKVSEGLKPIAQAAGDLYDHLAHVLVYNDNIDTARNAGLKARDEIIKNTPVWEPSRELWVDHSRAQADVSRLEELLAEANASTHPSSVAQAERLVPEINKAQDRFLKLNQRMQDGEVAHEQAIRHRAAAAQADAETGRVFSGGVNVEDSEGALQTLQQELGPRWGQVEQLARQAWDYADGLRQRMVQAGVWTPQRVESFQENSPHYVPTVINDFVESNAAGRGRGSKTLSVTDDLVHEASIEGTERAREDPLTALERATYQTERVARRNEVFNAFLGVRDAVPQLRDTIREVPSAGWDVLKDLTKEERAVRLAEHQAGERLLKDKPDYVSLRGFKDGAPVTYAMPKGIAEAIQGEPAMLINNGLGNFFKALSLGFTHAATTRFPVFLAGNATNDAVSYLVRESSRSGGPAHAAPALVDLAKSYWDTLLSPQALSDMAHGRWSGDAARFLKEGGGQFGFYSGMKNPTRGQNLRRTGFWDVKSPQELGKLMFDIATFKPVSELGSRIEMAPRLAAFRRAEKRGWDTTRSVIAGRDVTLDFARGGDWVKVANQFIPFLNAGVQGAVTPYRALRANPVGTMATAAGLIDIPTMAAEAWNRGHNLDGSFDAQRGRDYANVPDYDKYGNIIIMLPNAAPVSEDGTRKPEYAKIRLREWAPAAILAREAAARHGGSSPTAWQELLGQGAAQTMPVQGASDLLPPWLSTPIQLAANRNFFTNSDITTTGNNEKASAFSQGAAGPLTGLAQGITGNPYAKVEPSQIEFAARSAGAGLAGMGLGLSDVLAGRHRPQGAGVTDAPLVGGLARRFVGNATGQRLFDITKNPLPPDTMKLLRDAGIDEIPPPPPTDITVTGLAGTNMKLKPEQREEYNRVFQIAFNNIWSKLPPTAQHDKAALTETLSQARNQTSSAFQLGLTPEVVKASTTFKEKGDPEQQGLALDLAAELRDPKKYPKYVDPKNGKAFGDPQKWAAWDQAIDRRVLDGKPLSDDMRKAMMRSKQLAASLRDVQLFRPVRNAQGAVTAVEPHDPRYEAWNRHFGTYAGISEPFYQSYVEGRIPRYVNPQTGEAISMKQSDMFDRWLKLYNDLPAGNPLKTELRPGALTWQKMLTREWSQQLFGVDKAQLEAESGMLDAQQQQFAGGAP